ncbi:hypothetical protein Tco_1220878 [Tanacetum coccineum]
MRNKPGMDSLSFDDLYNNLRVFENDVKGSNTSSSNLHNIAFVSENTNSTNEVSTAYGFPTLGHCSSNEQTSNLIFLACKVNLIASMDHEVLDQVMNMDLEEMDSGNRQTVVEKVLRLTTIQKMIITLLSWLNIRLRSALRHMTGNKVNLADFNAIKWCAVAFGGRKGYFQREYSNARTPQQMALLRERSGTLIEGRAAKSSCCTAVQMRDLSISTNQFQEDDFEIPPLEDFMNKGEPSVGRSSLFICLFSFHHETKKISEAIEDERWVDVYRKCCCNLRFKKFGFLVDLIYRKRLSILSLLRKSYKWVKALYGIHKLQELVCYLILFLVEKWFQVTQELITLSAVKRIFSDYAGANLGTGKSTKEVVNFLEEGSLLGNAKSKPLWPLLLQKLNMLQLQAAAGQGKHFSGKVTPLFDTMLVQPTQDEGASSESQSVEQYFHPSPAPTVKSQNEGHSLTQLLLNKNILSANLGDHIINDTSLSGNEGCNDLQNVYVLCISKRISKEKRQQGESLKERGLQQDLYPNKGEEMQKDDGKQENAQSKGETKEKVLKRQLKVPRAKESLKEQRVRFERVLWGRFDGFVNQVEQMRFWSSQHEWEEKSILKKEIVVQMLNLKLESEGESYNGSGNMIRFIKKGNQLTLLLGDELASPRSNSSWKRISDKRMKNQAKTDKTEHGMEKRGKAKVKSKPMSKKVKVKSQPRQSQSQEVIKTKKIQL